MVRRSCLYWYALIVLEFYNFFLMYNKVRDFPSYQFGEIFFNPLSKLYELNYYKILLITYFKKIIINTLFNNYLTVLDNIIIK